MSQAVEVQVGGQTVVEVVTTPVQTIEIIAAGPQGGRGEDGTTMLHGSGAPSNALGVNNQFYLDTTAYVLYGPKTAGVWPAGVSLIGSQGLSAYQLAVATTGFSGTLPEWLASLNGTDGTDGTDGDDGVDGRGIVSVTRTSGNGAPGTTDTYTIAYTDATTSTFNIHNGADGTDGVDGDDGNDGRGIVSVTRTIGTGAPGTLDTYTITYSDATTSTFSVYNGANGADGTGTGDMLEATYDSDGDGKVNAAEVADAAPWTGITGKPATFAPEAHTHTIANVTGLQTALDGKADSGHSHAIANVTGLQTALDGKADQATTYTKTETDNRIQAIVGAAPAALDTLVEIATQLQADESTAAALTTTVAGKEAAITAGTTSQYWRGDKTWHDLNTDVRAAISAGGSLSYNPATGVFSYTAPVLATVATSGSYTDLTNKPTIPAAQVQTDWNAVSGMGVLLNKPTLATVATSGLYSDLSGKPTIPAAQVNSDWNSVSGVAQILNKPTIPSNTSQITESGNLYYTDARVRAAALTGLSTATATAVVATDSVLSAFGKVQGQIDTNTTAIAGKQATLVSGTNIKTINSNSLLGSGGITIDKTSVGLANVDNTSDANKPVSTATQAALDTKAAKTDPVVDNSLQIVNTNTTGDGTLAMSAKTGNYTSVSFRTNQVDRWFFGKNNAAETGSNAGSDFFLGAFSDTGSYLGTVFSASRATQAMNVNVALYVNSVPVVTTTGTQTLTNKTLTAPTITGYTETVYSLTGTAIDPANGTVQTKTLGANTTFTESLADGQSVVLHLNPATYTVTWPTISWVSAAGSGAAPTLKASVENVIVLWQKGGTLYGNWIGSL